MTIRELKLFEYRLPLKKPLHLSSGPVNEREGFVIQVMGEGGQVGYGEIAPLPGYSREDMEAVVPAVQRLRQAVVPEEIPEHLEELSGGFERWLGELTLPRSVRFGFECAVLSALAHSEGHELSRLISDSPRKHVTLNCMLSHISDEETLAAALEQQAAGFKTFKLKIGYDEPAADVSLLASLRQSLGEEAVIRLDANRQYTGESIGNFAEAIKSIGVEYIEEPLPTRDQSLEWARAGKLPVAMDESVTEIEPEDVADCPGVIALILKPTLLGLERTVQFARLASAKSIMPVISSTLESSLGLSTLAHLSLVVSRHDIAMGIATAHIFDGDLLDQPLTPVEGRIERADIPDPAQAILTDRLTEVIL